MLAPTPTVAETFSNVANDEMKTFLLVQIGESRLARDVFHDKGQRALFRVESQKSTISERAGKVSEAIECIVESITPLTTQAEYDLKVRQVMCRVYRTELGNIIDGIFDGFMNPVNEVTEGGHQNIITIEGTLDTIATCDFNTAVRIWNELGGNLTELANNPQWRTVLKVLNLKRLDA